MKTHGGAWSISPPFLTSALDGCEWSASSTDRITPGEISISYWLRFAGCLLDLLVHPEDGDNKSLLNNDKFPEATAQKMAVLYSCTSCLDAHACDWSLHFSLLFVLFSVEGSNTLGSVMQMGWAIRLSCNKRQLAEKAAFFRSKMGSGRKR
jgi:hypothetical protein